MCKTVSHTMSVANSRWIEGSRERKTSEQLRIMGKYCPKEVPLKFRNYLGWRGGGIGSARASVVYLARWEVQGAEDGEELL